MSPFLKHLVECESSAIETRRRAEANVQLAAYAELMEDLQDLYEAGLPTEMIEVVFNTPATKAKMAAIL